MKVFISQFYIEPGVFFPFSWYFQNYINGILGELLTDSSVFGKHYGAEYDLMFRMSAKRQIPETELRGPSRFPKSKSIEYSIFLPYDIIAASSDWRDAVLNALLDAVLMVLEQWGFNTQKFSERRSHIVASIVGDPQMIDRKRIADSGLNSGFCDDDLAS